jgi:hypothetical protein
MRQVVIHAQVPLTAREVLLTAMLTTMVYVMRMKLTAVQTVPLAISIQTQQMTTTHANTSMPVACVEDQESTQITTVYATRMK